MKIGKVEISRSGRYFNAYVRWFIFWIDLGPAFPTQESAIAAIKRYRENKRVYV